MPIETVPPWKGKKLKSGTGIIEVDKDRSQSRKFKTREPVRVYGGYFKIISQPELNIPLRD